MEISSNQILTGCLSKFNIAKCYGFIDTVDGNSYFFFNDKSEIRKKDLNTHHVYREGDEVEFKIKPDPKYGFRSYDVTFIKNSKRDKVIEEAIELNILKGYLKKIDGNYYIKHDSTYLLIPINISEWETDIDLIYDDRINSLVTFELQDLEKPYKISAILIDRVFRPEYTLANELQKLEQSTFATITGNNASGFFCYILHDTIKGFIAIDSGDLATYSYLKKGVVVEVKIKRINIEAKYISLVLVINKDEVDSITKRSFEFKKEHFGQTLVEKRKTTLIERTHGIVVNYLAIELQNRNYKVGNDSNRDLIIHDGENVIKCIFEIKTSSSTQSIYTAVGQLIIYSISIETISGLFIVLPDLLKGSIKDKLKELKITPIYYSWHDGKPLFHNLDKALSGIF